MLFFTSLEKLRSKKERRDNKERKAMRRVETFYYRGHVVVIFGPKSPLPPPKKKAKLLQICSFEF